MAGSCQLRRFLITKKTTATMRAIPTRHPTTIPPMAPPERLVDNEELAVEVVVTAGDVLEEVLIDEDDDDEENIVEVADATEARLVALSVRTDADGLADEREE